MNTGSQQYGPIPVDDAAPLYHDIWQEVPIGTEPPNSNSPVHHFSIPSDEAPINLNDSESRKPYFKRKQTAAFLLVLFCGVGPFLSLMIVSYTHMYSLEYLFTPKVFRNCGDFFGNPQNSTVKGVEAFFVLDLTFGSLPFSKAKTIDVAWDVLVGRGTQLFAAWASYITFSAALLRIIERHPASYRTFLRIALDGTSVPTVWALLKDMFRVQSRRTGALFFHIALSMLYVLSIPVILSAMTGYDSSTISYVSLEDNDRIIPASSLEENAILVWRAGDITFPTPICSKTLSTEQDDLFADWDARDSCNCKLPDSTFVSFGFWLSAYETIGETWDYQDCRFDYPGNIQTYEDAHMNRRYCNSTIKTTLTISNQTFEYRDIQSWSGYCYNNQGYTYSNLLNNMRCLPDTAHPSYGWGFSSKLSTIFVILQCVWSITMYIIWQDAHCNSKLVRGGYNMTQLRAVFALATAASWETGLDTSALVRADTKNLSNELFGNKEGVGGVMVSKEVFLGMLDKGSGSEDGSLKKRSVRIREEETWRP